MKLPEFIAPLILPALLCGCAATRPFADIGAAAAGGYIGNELSDGDPIATAAGAAAGVVASEALHHAARKQSEKAYANGYDKGRSDAVKQQYWLYVAQQRARDREGQVRLYEVQLPEQTIDGVTFKPTTKYLRIEE